MKNRVFLFFAFLLVICGQVNTYAAGLENRSINISSNERFNFINGSSIQFKFKPLSDKARELEITRNASSLGVAYLGQIQLKENITALSALRSIADQIGESLNLSFGVIADSNTSEALKLNELLLLYHPAITVTLVLARPNEESNYEIICTYALRDLKEENARDKQTISQAQGTNQASENPKPQVNKQEEAVNQ